MNRFHCFTLVAASLVAIASSASAKLARTEDSLVSFTATGPGGMKIIGSTPDLSIVDEADGITVVVPLTNLTTGIALRDKHMREKYLETSQYPTATFVVKKSDLNLPAAGAQLEADVRGAMTMHGQTRPVVFHYSAKHEGPVFAVSGAVHVNMKDFGIEVPSYLGVSVKPDVDIVARFEARDAS